jgi:cellulose synthase/poly-beta-1,6-N-acetylglucosamine synthase-like glycosyltransferase
VACRKLDQHFEERAIELAREAGKPIAQVARDLGINDRTLRSWVALDRRRSATAGVQAAARPRGQGQTRPTGPRSSPPAGEDWATWGAARDGARVVLTRVQAFALGLPIVLSAVLIGVNLRYWLMACLGIVTGLYFLAGVHKMWLLVRGEAAATGTAADPQLPAADELPVYTVLVPLYREGRILPTLVERLRRLDYPAERLQVLLLIEADDEETQRAARDYPFPSHIRPLLMPLGQPRTKPRALNIGLHEAQGEYIVVYDAEDQPEPDQLRKAVAAMRALPTDVVCLQARLNFYNRHQSVLARLGAIDYAVWYDHFLPGLTSGLAQPGAFVPLGGTSNHFRVEILRKVGGWDPYNVTEDCDLGVRLGRDDLRVAMLDSTTWEEAVPRAKPWVRQRSRWIKGYIQTYLVHMRRPLKLWRELGLRGFVDFQMLVGASSLLLLINPLMWTMTALYIASKGTGVGNFIQTLFPAPVYYLALLSLTVWNFIFFYCNVYACVRHNFLDLTRYTLLVPAYWVLMSLGAWTGLISLVYHPSYWAKTEHGFSLSKTGTSAGAAIGSMEPEPSPEGA